MSRIQTDKRVLPYLPVSTEERRQSDRGMPARGTAHLRTRVNIDLESCFKRCGELCCDYIHL
jgi:hypothetical protein